MRVALAQYQPAAAVSANLDVIGRIVELAGEKNIDLAIFSGDFLGELGDEAAHAVPDLQDLAKRFNVEMLVGRVGIAGLPAQAALIGRDGQLVDWVPAGEIRPLRPCLGSTLVFSEEQAYSAESDRLALQFRPKVMVMQAGANSLLELEAIKELTIDRSYNQAHLVICVSVVGKWREEHYLGAGLAVLQGEILAEAETAAGELIIFSVDPTKFIDYDELRDPVTIPELLRQKYGPHDIGHDSDSL
ncbi:MAG: hypothetical protein Q8L35_03720 [Actinomycetota bacterium]|nr:hypothetical protein [Actinomycetota bacterium]